MKKKIDILNALVTLTVLILILSCSGGEMEQKETTYSSLHDVPEATWKKLTKKIFYFGHQSVGYNILDGIQDLMNEYPQIKLAIVETNDVSNLAPGTLAHSKVGQNTKPETKIAEFARYIRGGIGKKADAAALKLCYVDIRADAEPEKLFSDYEKEMEKIRQAFPHMTIIHFTSPLTTLQTGPKVWVKKILGRTAYGVRENINRYAYNELLRKRYKGKDPILDIAMIESTRPDGTRVTFEFEGKSYYSIFPEYTNNGGHLSEVGKKKVAEQLLLLLVSL